MHPLRAESRSKDRRRVTDSLGLVENYCFSSCELSVSITKCPHHLLSNILPPPFKSGGLVRRVTVTVNHDPGLPQEHFTLHLKDRRGDLGKTWFVCMASPARGLPAGWGTVRQVAGDPLPSVAPGPIVCLGGASWPLLLLFPLGAQTRRPCLCDTPASLHFLSIP